MSQIGGQLIDFVALRGRGSEAAPGEAKRRDANIGWETSAQPLAARSSLLATVTLEEASQVPGGCNARGAHLFLFLFLFLVPRLQKASRRAKETES